MMMLATLLAQAPANPAPPQTVAVPGLRVVTANAQARGLLEGHVMEGLRRAGYSVRDGASLRQEGLKVPEEGCVSARPLCGAAPGVDMVLLGLVRESEGRYEGLFELRASPNGTLLWKEGVHAASAEELGAQLEARLGSAAPAVTEAQVRTGPGFKPQTWGWMSLTAGTLSAIGGGALLAIASRKLEMLHLSADGANRLYTKDAIRYSQEGPRDIVLGSALIGLGAAGIAAGIHLATQPDAPVAVPTVTLAPDVTRPGFVLSGVLP